VNTPEETLEIVIDSLHDILVDPRVSGEWEESEHWLHHQLQKIYLHAIQDRAIYRNAQASAMGAPSW
jgi:hypothetical protein